MTGKVYIAIDLKSFYASVECVDRGLDPLTENLVVADITKTEKTICLAVSPSLKALGIPGRARLFEVMEKAQNINLTIAPPRMARYVEISTKIFGIYGRYIAPEDIHVYSVDEVFMDVTNYLKTYNMSPRELAMTMIKDVLEQTGITATAGIGENMYLAKIAMDIVAKKMPADKNGVRIAELTEKTYREKLWAHEPLTDFWRVGKGISKRLNNMGIKTMGDLARYSLVASDKLYKEFGINAELLIDHAWGYEPVEMKDVKNYKSESHSISSGQVLSHSYTKQKARIVIQEMADNIALDLMQKGLFTDQIVLFICYESLFQKKKGMLEDFSENSEHKKIKTYTNGTINIGKFTCSSRKITEKTLELFDKIVDDDYKIKKLYITLNHVTMDESKNLVGQLNMFVDYKEEHDAEEKDHRLQNAELAIKKKFGKNAIFKAISLEDGATQIMRNNQIGGHKA